MKTLRKVSFVVITFAFIGSGVSAAQLQNHDAADRALAKRLWDMAIEAKGGRDRLHSITNAHLSERGKYRCCLGFRHVNYVYEALMVFPDKSWEWDDQRGTVFGFAIRLHNFEKNIHQSFNISGSVVPITKPSERDLIRLQLHLLMETKWVRPVPLSTRVDTLNGKEVDIVETRVTGLNGYNDKVEFGLDRNTHLPREVIYHWTTGDGRSLSGGVSLSKYVIVAGLQVPSQIERQKFTYEFNVAYDDKIFDNRPNAALGIYAWRKK